MAKRQKKTKLQKSKEDNNSKYWRVKADKRWSEIVRSVGKCEICGSKDFLNAHHLISKKFKVHRHNLSNGLCLCCKCHVFDLKHSPHLAAIPFAIWMKKNRPSQYEWVERHSRMDKDVGHDYKRAFEDLSGKQ